MLLIRCFLSTFRQSEQEHATGERSAECERCKRCETAANGLEEMTKHKRLVKARRMAVDDGEAKGGRLKPVRTSKWTHEDVRDWRAIGGTCTPHGMCEALRPTAAP